MILSEKNIHYVYDVVQLRRKKVLCDMTVFITKNGKFPFDGFRGKTRQREIVGLERDSLVI